jgi:hypothetical protein
VLPVLETRQMANHPLVFYALAKVELLYMKLPGKFLGSVHNFAYPLLLMLDLAELRLFLTDFLDFILMSNVPFLHLDVIVGVDAVGIDKTYLAHRFR